MEWWIAGIIYTSIVLVGFIWGCYAMKSDIESGRTKIKIKRIRRMV